MLYLHNLGYIKIKMNVLQFKLKIIKYLVKPNTLTSNKMLFKLISYNIKTNGIN